MRTVAGVCIICCSLVGSLAARDIFVNNVAGDDKNRGSAAAPRGDSASPVRTIAKALRLARGGDRIVLADAGQSYRESISLVGSRHSGVPAIPFILDGGGATLDGSVPIPAESWTHYRDNLFRFRPTTLDGAVLFLDNRAIDPLPLESKTAFPPRLDPGQWCVLEGSIYFAVEKSKLPGDYKLSYAAQPTGITLYHVDHVIVRNLTIQGFQVDGIAAADSAHNVVLNNATCKANGRAGVSVRGGAQVEIDGCKLSGNGLGQLMTFANSQTHLFKSDLANDTARAWVDRGGRVYLGTKLVEGGLKAIKAEDAPR